MGRARSQQFFFFCRLHRLPFIFPPLVTFETKRTTGYHLTSDCFQENKHVHNGYQKGGYLRFSSLAVQRLFGYPRYQSAVTIMDAAGRNLTESKVTQSYNQFKLFKPHSNCPRSSLEENRTGEISGGTAVPAVAGTRTRMYEYWLFSFLPGGSLRHLALN
ncbi:unnamed protein product [Ixodes persulcatus]